jgi:MYXO-CTERM domain-containing protein
MAIGLAAVLALPSRAVTIYDTGGFEGYNTGAIAGQQGWVDTSVPGLNTTTRPVNQATIDVAPGGSKAVLFNDIQPSQTAIETHFANLTGTYKFARATFDLLREDAAIYNNLDWWPTGANPWYGTAWDAAANPPGKIIPFGDSAFGSVDQTPGVWQHVDLLFDLENGLGSGWVNGVQVTNNANIGKGEFNGWYFDDWQTVDQGRTPGAVGRRGWVDNLSIYAGANALEASAEGSAIPEPASLALLGAGLLPLLRRRK